MVEATRRLISQVCSHVQEPALSTKLTNIAGKAKKDLSKQWNAEWQRGAQARQIERYNNPSSRPKNWKRPIRRYLCYSNDCTISANDAHEASRHWRHGNLPGHSWEEYEPSNVFWVDYELWLKDEELRNTRIARNQKEWMDGMREDGLLGDEEEIEAAEDDEEMEDEE